MIHVAMYCAYCSYKCVDKCVTLANCTVKIENWIEFKFDGYAYFLMYEFQAIYVCHVYISFRLSFVRVTFGKHLLASL